jgi:hypothetical protein
MASQRYRTLTYDNLTDKFTDQSCTIAKIDFPDIDRAHSVDVYLTSAKGPQRFHTSERKEIVDFSVKYIPHDSSDGRALLPHVKEVVDAVLTKDYKPAVATINLIRNGETEKTITVNDCVVTGGEIIVDKGQSVEVIFYLHGLLSSDY